MDHSPHPQGDGQGPGYETRDLALKPIIYFVVGLLLFGASVQFVMAKIMSGIYMPQSDVASVPKYDNILRDIGPVHAAPPLQREPVKDMLDMYKEEDEVLGGYKVDAKAGTRRIPLDRAMEIVARKGLPVRPNPPERAADKTYSARREPYKVSQ